MNTIAITTTTIAIIIIINTIISAHSLIVSYSCHRCRCRCTLITIIIITIAMTIIIAITTRMSSISTRYTRRGQLDQHRFGTKVQELPDSRGVRHAVLA